MAALNITGSATSMYMQQFWGHDENLMYYRNHVYPLMGPGWGSTADYILLSDGDTIDVAHVQQLAVLDEGRLRRLRSGRVRHACGRRRELPDPQVRHPVRGRRRHGGV